MAKHSIYALLLVVITVFLAACGGVSSPRSGGTPTPTPSPTASPTATPTPVPQIGHVAIVVLENAGYSDVIGNVSMPYLNSLATSGSLATNYFANFHPSIGNYFMMTAGNGVTNDDAFTGTVSVDNLVREMAASNVSWKSYQESIPSAGYLGGDSGTYLKRHNPFAYFTDVVNDATQAAKIVPYTQLAADSTAGQLPNLIFITPNSQHDAHDCPGGGSSCTLNDKLAAADQWMQSNLPALLADPGFSTDGLLIVLFDEAQNTDATNGGGHVAFVLSGTHVKVGFSSTTLYQHQNLLALIGTVLRVGTIPGAGATANNMSEFLQ